jgi:DNA repair exonuclease SbcCD ATPase subunit
MTDIIQEIQFADLEYYEKVDMIYHISDIHIRLQKRHDEYKKVFSNLYKQLKEDVGKSKGVIVITGDILHSKTELSPECVSITADFFQKLSKIMPLIIMAGNHDANLNNNNRLDSLTPIVEKVISKSQCYYLRQSGFYRFGNIVFGLTSVFDYNFCKASDIESLELEGIDYKIGLFHGRVDGAITDTGSIMEGERGINKKSFDGYDYTLLGDIHKQQFLIPNKMAYSGSLIQQNHGESQKGHGYLVWDLINKSVIAKDVANDYGYVTLRIRDGKLMKNKEAIIPSKCYLRLEIDNMTTREQQKAILSELNEKRTILELIQTNTRSTNNTINSENADNTDNTDNTDNMDDNDNDEKHQNMIRSLSFNVSNPQFQNNEIEKYLISKSVSPEMITQIKKLNLEYNQQVLIGEALLGSSWKIKHLEFSNLFCYGENNYISFEKSKGIVGLVAPNHSGKSSILDIILYTLFDKTSRKGTGKEIIRLGEKSFKAKLEIEMGDKTFIILKKGTKKLSDTMSVSIDFSYYSRDLETNKIVSTKLNGKTPAETRRVIESYFGTFDDMIMTSISLQNNNTQFADSTSAEKRKEFEKLLRIDIFEKLKDISLENSREKKAVIKHLTSELPENALKNLLEDHISLSEKLTNIENTLIIEKEELSELRQTESGLMIRLSSAINKVPEQYKELAKQGEKYIENHKTKIMKDIKELNVDPLTTAYSNVNIEEWKTQEDSRKKQLNDVENKLTKLSRNLNPLKNELDKPIQLLNQLESDKSEYTDILYKLKKEIKKLKECDWDEKNMVNGICTEIIHKLKVMDKYKNMDKSTLFEDIELCITEILDTHYQPGSEKDLKKIQKKYTIHEEKLSECESLIKKWTDYNKTCELKKENEIILKEIKTLEEKKSHLSKSEFDVYGYMCYQKYVKLTKDYSDLLEACQNIKIYTDTLTELNVIMNEIIDKEYYVNTMEEERGNMKGSIGVVETEMKTNKDKKQKLEEYILELDVMTTYQDCLKAVPFIIIDKIIPQLEKTINMMLSSLVTFTINFNVSEKELNVYITRPHGQLPLSNASGFEKFVGSLFLRIGLIKISNLPKANFLAIDEGWSNFDYENMNNVSMIMDYLRDEFDFVIIVSHLQTMREQTDQQININIEKKTGGVFGVSSVQYPIKI